ncbi:outer envelope pore protein 24A, chloroplastic-like [Punica granatum]|uniref:Uncharacterized protein n=2 Tax=Punica granatum TaxID=22663 RepID=A0A218WRT4_PUNGR|nr:outer envelope pore protein 24A, chloroplastic-like [Punica granatum]OWM75080.1 hypothetical protein CDL15_Pgr021431 [Punica granatum]PKI65939.1 hypothetical protein CRG98_013659 [Punica granatum]
MKGSLKCRYDVEKNGAAATLGVSAGDVKLRASLTDATIVNGPSLNGLALAVEKPGSFIIDYNVPKNDYRFQFMNTVKVVNKPLNLTYIHGKGDNLTIVEGSFVFDPANKVSANYILGSSNCKLKYTYVHRARTTFEPSYDTGRSSWDFAMSQKVFDDDVLKATYQPLTKALGLEWSRNSKLNGCFKISASLNLEEELKMPKLIAETTWNLDL